MLLVLINTIFFFFTSNLLPIKLLDIPKRIRTYFKEPITEARGVSESGVEVY